MNEHVRNLKDASKIVTKACPAANANHNSDGLDLEQTLGGELEAIAFEIEIPALPNLADTKTLTVKVQDSADNSTFADLDPAISTSVVGVSTNGSAAKTVRFRLPPNARRYVSLNLAVAASGGDNTAKSVTLSALF